MPAKSDLNTVLVLLWNLTQPEPQVLAFLKKIFSMDFFFLFLALTAQKFAFRPTSRWLLDTTNVCISLTVCYTVLPNPFVSNTSFSTLWKYQKNLRFQGVEKGCIGNKWVKTRTRSHSNWEDCLKTYWNLEIIYVEISNLSKW